MRTVLVVLSLAACAPDRAAPPSEPWVFRTEEALPLPGSPDGRYAAWHDERRTVGARIVGTLHLVDLAEGTEVALEDVSDQGLAWSHDAGLLTFVRTATGDLLDLELSAWSAGAGERRVGRLLTDWSGHAVAPDGGLVLHQDEAGAAWAWRADGTSALLAEGGARLADVDPRSGFAGICLDGVEPVTRLFGPEGRVLEVAGCVTVGATGRTAVSSPEREDEVLVGHLDAPEAERVVVPLAPVVLRWSDGGETLAVAGDVGGREAVAFVDAPAGTVERAEGGEVPPWGLHSSGETWTWFDQDGGVVRIRHQGATEVVLEGACASSDLAPPMTRALLGVAAPGCAHGGSPSEVYAWTPAGVAGPWPGAGAAVLDRGLVFRDGRDVRWTDGVAEPVTLEADAAGFGTDGSALVVLRERGDGGVELDGDVVPAPPLDAGAWVGIVGSHAMAGDARQVVLAALR